MLPSAPDCALRSFLQFRSLQPGPSGSCVPWTRGRKHPPELLVETGAGPGLRWPTMLAGVLFLLQRPPCWLPGPRHGTSSPPPNQNQSDAAALSCSPKAFLGGRVSFVTILSLLWGHCPLSPAQCACPQAAPLSALPPRERASSVHRASSGEGGHSGVPLERGCHRAPVSHCSTSCNVFTQETNTYQS